MLITNTRLAVRRRADTARDSHGEPVPGGWGTVSDLLPGVSSERADGTWSLGLDPSLWPVRQGDQVVDDTGRVWLVTTADLFRNAEYPTVDWIRVSAHQRTTAGFTEPGGAAFAGR